MGGFSMVWWHWCVAGLVFLGLEIAIPGAFLLWIGVGAVITGLITAVFGLTDWQIQALGFVLLSFAALYLGRKYIRRATPAEDQVLNRRLAAYVDNSAVLVEAIAGGRGKVRLGDTLWRVRGPDLPAGTRVRVSGVDGSDLLVTPEE